MIIPEYIANEPKRTVAPPAWLNETPMISAGNHDNIPIFTRRLGGGTTWQEEDYKNSTSEDLARKLKAAGITLWVSYFYKGFGLKAEQEYIDKIRNFSPVLKKYGIKVGLYVGSTIAYETFLLEKPEAEEWFVPDYLGEPVFYANQTFRKRVYCMHPGYLEYMKRVVSIGVSEVKADMIHFDNTSMQAYVSVFQHPAAAEDFREYLKHKYTPEGLQKRLGISDVRYVVPPKYPRPLTTIDDPMFQVWTDFRCHQLNSYYAEMERLIHGLNPECVVHSNPHSELSGRNTIWDQGISYPGLFAHMDAVTSEEGDYAGVTDDGILVSCVRSFKNATCLGTRMYVSTGGSTLQMAESMTFSRQSLGHCGEVLNQPDWVPQWKYMKYFHEKFEYYREVENIADVAVLYSYASMGFNNDRPAVSFILFTQALIQGRIPFDIIPDAQLKDLSKYRALVLADQECLSDEQMEQVRRYVRVGGGLVATEFTSLYTPWRLRRANFGLKDLFGVDAPRWEEEVADSPLKIGPLQNQVGRGRVAYIADVQPAIAKPPAVPMTNQYWKLPLNWEELLGAVAWAAGRKLSLEVKAPLTQYVVVELMKQEGRRLVHLINYDRERNQLIRGIEVEVEFPPGKRVTQVKVLTPEREGEVQVSHTSAGNRVHFQVPELETYNLAVIQME